MASLRTILALTVPAVTALFGIFWLFNKKKSPPHNRLTEPPDKKNLRTAKNSADKEEQGETDQIAQKGEKEVDAKVKVAEKKLENDKIVEPNSLVIGDSLNPGKQNKSHETKDGNAGGDYHRFSEQNEVQESNEREQMKACVVDCLDAIAVEFEDKLNKDSGSHVSAEFEDELNKDKDVSKISGFSNVNEEPITPRNADNTESVNVIVNSSDNKINADQVQEEVGSENDREFIEEAQLCGSSINSLSSEPIQGSPSIEDVTAASNKDEAVEDLVIPSVEPTVCSALDWSKNEENLIVSEQTELNLESQIIPQQISDSETNSSVTSAITSQIHQIPDSVQKTINDMRQRDSLNSVDNLESVSAADENVTIDKTPEKAKESSECLGTVESSQSESPWLADQIVTESWTEDKTSSHKHSVSDEPKLNSWVVNGEQLDTMTDSIQENLVENVISNKSANAVSPSRREILTKRSVEQRTRRGGSLNSSESSSNCDNSSVTSSGSSRGGSTPETINHHVDDKDHVYEFNMPSDLCGLFIGTKGKTVKAIRDQSGARLRLRNNPYTPDFQICVIEGSQSAIDRACNIIKKKFPSVKYPGMDITPINSSPVLMPEIMQLSLPEGVSVDVVVSSIVDAGRIFVQQPTHPSFPSLERLNSYMLTCYIQEGAVPDIPRPIENGVICAAPMLNGWYRAQIMAVFDGTDECDIKYVDYGGYSRISSQCLKQIRSDFMTLPFEAVECYMANITPLQGESYFSPEAAAVLEELTQGKLLQAQVVGRAEDGIPYVHIYQISGNTSVCVGPSIVACYQDLAKQITVTMKHEDRRCQYLSTQAKIMTTVHDDIATLPEDSIESQYGNILERSQLAQHLSQIYNNLGQHGEVHLYLNNWIEINFCLPHKLHYVQVGNKALTMEPDAFLKFLKYLRPYHGILVLQDENTLLESLPLDSTPALSHLIQVTNPLRRLQTLS